METKQRNSPFEFLNVSFSKTQNIPINGRLPLDLATQKLKLTDDEKDMKSKCKMIQKKLNKFATRIPVFMYLTDHRKPCLKDVITQLEPVFFHKVTGLDVKDFELLVSLNVFNSALMNDAMYKFKRYEDASLEYIGFDNSMKYESPVSGYDTLISRRDYEEMFVNQDR